MSSISQQPSSQHVDQCKTSVRSRRQSGVDVSSVIGAVERIGATSGNAIALISRGESAAITRSRNIEVFIIRDSSSSTRTFFHDARTGKCELRDVPSLRRIRDEPPSAFNGATWTTSGGRKKFVDKGVANVIQELHPSLDPTIDYLR
ncbi:hypothetical protein G5I_03910 [Acromyrmex echinatior]|uniref:Uncharacterized protein n=1 Tax=Acromyrmex echinatior TaxID=103372 RepID=F4WE79_ACREC|nr:hypothetical protein G5I_03910 [Acromyrmex echinatior]